MRKIQCINLFILLFFLMIGMLFATEPVVTADSLKINKSDSLEVFDYNKPLIPGLVGQTKTFYLKDGNIFNGLIKNIDEKGNVTLNTEEGVLVLPYKEILEETVVINKKTEQLYPGSF